MVSSHADSMDCVIQACILDIDAGALRDFNSDHLRELTSVLIHDTVQCGRNWQARALRTEVSSIRPIPLFYVILTHI